MYCKTSIHNSSVDQSLTNTVVAVQLYIHALFIRISIEVNIFVKFQKYFENNPEADFEKNIILRLKVCKYYTVICFKLNRTIFFLFSRGKLAKKQLKKSPSRMFHDNKNSAGI